MIFDWISFLLITLFYCIYYGKQIILRKQGINTARLAKGRKPEKTRRIEAALMIATFGTAAVQYTSLFFGDLLLTFPLPRPFHVVGWALLLLGLIFFLLATINMQNNWRAGIDETQKTSMVTSGIYRISRNPAFVGFDLIYLGSVLVFPNGPMLVFALFAMIMLHCQILEEEKHLPSVFGQQYLNYKARTARYLFMI